MKLERRESDVNACTSEVVRGQFCQSHSLARSSRGLGVEQCVGITDTSSGVARSDEIVTLVKSIVDQVNARVSSTESIKKFVVLERDFEIEQDEITPTGKIKRDVVTERYGELIQSL